MAERTDPWEYDGRYYAVTKISDVADRDGFGWELADVAPPPGRGLLLEVFLDDRTTEITFRSFTDRALPVALVERFVREATVGVRPTT